MAEHQANSGVHVRCEKNIMPWRMRSIERSRPDELHEPTIFDHWTSEGLVIEFIDAACFQITRDHVALIEQNTDDVDLVAHLVVDHVLPRVVWLRGDLMLHASGVVGPNGGAHVFLGKSGTGKSTLATALGCAGWPILDDDGIRIMNIRARPWACPGYPGVRLLPDSAESVLPTVAPGRRVMNGHAKRRFEADGAVLAVAHTRAPVVGVYLMERTKRHSASLVPVGIGETVRDMSNHTFHVSENPSASVRESFERTAALFGAVPVWRLLIPTGLTRIGSTLALLHEHDFELGAQAPR